MSGNWNDPVWRREHLREYLRRWQAANPQKCSEYQRKWRNKNLDKLRPYWRQWYHANKERLAESRRKRDRKRYVTNKETIRETSRKRYASNRKYREHLCEKQRMYNASHRDSIRSSNRKRYHANREQRLAYRQDYYKANEQRCKDTAKRCRLKKPEKYRRSIRRCHLNRKYGLTLEQYQQMYDSQEGKCAICGNSNGDKLLAVDHNHSTSKVRGLLCTPCNARLSMFEDEEWERKAKLYLAKYSSETENSP